MISLITGVPGSGKTAWLVHQLMTRPDLKDRPLFVHNIPELKIPYLPIPEGEKVETWPDWAPTGAIIVVDECQKVFRPRRSGSDVPTYVSELETHRHRGLDFFLLTQNPRLIDANVRDLVGEHRHISKTLLGIRRMLYWNTGGAKNPAARRDIAEAVASVYKLPKEAFGMYKSAEEHTQVGGKKSIMLFILPIALIITIILFVSLINRYQAKTNNPQSAVSADATATVERAALAISDNGAVANPTTSPTNGLHPDMYVPTIHGQPWTAPIYSPQNTQIATMPFPVGCVKTDTDCTCYTDQATPIRQMDKNLCIDFVDNGIYNPYKAKTETATTAPTAETSTVNN